VIRLDRRRGPLTRPETPGPPTAAWNFRGELVHRNKRSVALALDRPDGAALAHALVAQTDVFLTDQSVEALRASALDYATLAAVKPDLIYARGSGFGPTGPDCDLPAVDELAAARTGMMPILPQPGQPPVYPGHGQMYTTLLLAFGIATALHHRAETGEGQQVDSSLLAGNMYGASLDLQAFLAIGGERFLHPVSRLDAGNPMSGTMYRAADGPWVTLTMPDTDRWWPGFAPLVGIDPKDPRFDSHEKRCEQNRHELMAALEDAFRGKPAAEWRRGFAEAQLSADVIEDYAYPAADPEAYRNRYLLALDDPSFGPVTMLGFPIFMSESPARLARTAPCAGQHTAEVLRDVLGRSEDDIIALAAAGTIG
jgi:formyl-CoA transferase